LTHEKDYDIMAPLDKEAGAEVPTDVKFESLDKEEAVAEDKETQK